LHLTGSFGRWLSNEANLILLPLTLVAIVMTFVEFGQRLIKVSCLHLLNLADIMYSHKRILVGSLVD